MASDAFSTIKKEAIFLVDFKWAIFFLINVLMESIWLGNNGERHYQKNCLKIFLLQLQDPDEKHLIENLVPKLNIASPLISFLESD